MNSSVPSSCIDAYVQGRDAHSGRVCVGWSEGPAGRPGSVLCVRGSVCLCVCVSVYLCVSVRGAPPERFVSLRNHQKPLPA